MKNFINKYDLKKGLLLSIAFPLIFLALDGNPSNILSHFTFSFVITFSFWIVNSILIDFKNLKKPSAKTTPYIFYSRLAASFVFAIIIYVSLGLLLHRSAIIFSMARGNWGSSFSSWFYLCMKIILFNSLIILIKYLYDINAEKRKIEFENEVLKRENLNALHESLKQQVNPHFLFNSLNTLKSLTSRNPEQAVDFITELSSVYRYMLLHQDKENVTLRDEIEFLKSYLYLLKIRFGDAINTEIILPDELLNYSMPPNTLQLLIENAVKHNALSLQKPLCISIYAENNYLTVQNNLRSKRVLPSSSHLGLSNISNRYLLLKGKDIIIKKTEENFIVLLPIM
ncbi:MAG: histidine kinase [Bacteroidota bacterium]|nr:histidine kinase [Bacteroidota bacterium]